MKGIIFFILAFLLFPTYGFSKTNTIKVLIDVSADEVVKDEVQSGINQRLRNYSDIVLVANKQDDPDYILSVIVMQTKQNSGFVSGYSGSVNVIGRLGPKAFKSAVAKLKVSKQINSKDEKILDNCGNLVTNYMFDYPISGSLVDAELSGLIDRIVAFADSNAFETLRKNGESLDQ